jgi:hypothetical protein
MLGAGVAVTGGEKRLPPVGLMVFSVGETGALLEGVAGVVVGVVVEVDGASVPLPPQAAVNALSAIRAAPPTATATRRWTLLRLMAASPPDMPDYGPNDPQ